VHNLVFWNSYFHTRCLSPAREDPEACLCPESGYCTFRDATLSIIQIDAALVSCLPRSCFPLSLFQVYGIFMTRSASVRLCRPRHTHMDGPSDPVLFALISHAITVHVPRPFEIIRLIFPGDAWKDFPTGCFPYPMRIVVYMPRLINAMVY